MQGGEIQTSNVSLTSEEMRSPMPGLHLQGSLEMLVVGRSGLRAPPRLPCGVEGNKAARSEGEDAALVCLQVFFWDTTAERSI